MHRQVIAVERSGDKKLTRDRASLGCAATYVSQRQCSPDCPLMDGLGRGPCYGNAGHVAITLRRLNRAPKLTPIQAARLEAGEVVLVMSNGDFGNIWEKLLAALAA